MQAAFRKEVQETFLRCVDMGYDQDLAVIELNGLKIAEARDFADNACYITTTILALCLPAAPRVREEYRSLFPDTAPDSTSPVGALQQLAFLPCEHGMHAHRMSPLVRQVRHCKELLDAQAYTKHDLVYHSWGAASTGVPL